MILDEYKPNKKRFWGSKTFYVVLMLCVMAAGFAAWSAVNSTMKFETDKTHPENDKHSTVDWGNYSDRIVTDDGNNANVPATGIPDERNNFEKNTDKESEETKAVPTTQKDTDNTPYVGKYTMPMGTNILKDFSSGEMVASKTMNDWRVHNGIDFKGNVGEEVVAIQDGTVKSVTTDELWGTVVVIKHGNGLVAKYCGLSEGSTVKQGNEIGVGDRVGLLGEIPIESADEQHLHFEVLVNDKIVDPLTAMNKAGE